ncbi:UNVERIFIED_CONTAM: hypothetical protein PYX00_010359 [Menopon gallinae]|uniref:Endothelin-converting enzyme 1 n=1 Tax=Menopon gallinae TaxID=328185 RepID=A0AAW2HEX5_9NEOP
MASKASTPEVESVRQQEDGNKLDGGGEEFENLDSQAEDFQATEEDPCFPLNHKSNLSEKESVSTSRSSIDKKQLDYLENEKDERILVHDNNIDYSMPNSKTPKSKLSFINKIGRNGDGKKLNFANSTFEKRVRKNLGLTHYGFVVGIVLLCLIILSLLIIIVLGITWPKIPHSQLYPICTKTACLRASSLVLPKLDKSIPPCDDFYGFLCGHWNKKHSKPPPTRSRWGPEEEMDLRLSEMIRGLISTLPHPTRANSLTWKMKNFYDSCMSLDNIETDKERPLTNIIFDLGGWSVLRNFLILTWDFTSVLIRLHDQYGVEPFFSVSVVSDPRNASRNILQISPTGLGLPHTSYYYREKNDKMATSYIRYMKDVAQLLGATSNDANSFSEDMFYFERRIAEITPPAEELEDIRKHEIHTINSLKILAPSIPIHGLLDKMMGKPNIDDDTEVLVTSTFYLSKISNIVATIDRKALNNYVLWTLVKQYLPYLSQSFTDIYYIYNRGMAGLAEPMERWEFCIKTLQKYMDVGLVVQLEKRIPLPVRTENARVSEEIFQAIRMVIKESVTKSDWIDLDLHKHMISKLDNLTLKIGFPAEYLDYTYLEEYYSKLYVQKNNFFENIQYGVSFLKEEMRRRYAYPKEEYKWIRLMSSQTEVSYIPSANMVVVPQRLLMEPYFESDYPKAMQYGTLGVDIARKIVSSLFKYNVLYSANGTRIKDRTLLANLSLTSIDNQMQCLGGLAASLDVPDEKITNRTSLNTFVSMSAVRQALKALKRATAESEHVHQVGLEEYENDSLFYIAYGQRMCIVQTSQRADVENTTSSSLGNKQFIKAIGMQLKSFADAFHCPTPSNYCKDIL